MIYLTTGGNGASKTLLTLKDLRDAQLEWEKKGEFRQVYYHGFEPVKDVIEGQFGWLPHDPKDWMSLPDNSVLFWDEAQNYIGTRSWQGKEPQWVADLAQFRRKRGFDIWICTPHPSMIHTFVRRLISSPSWHRHLKRVFGMEASSQIMYDAPNMRCEEMGAGQDQEVKTRAFPKEVYQWYISASKHTGKRKIPRAVYVLAAVLVAVPLCGYIAVKTLWSSHEKRTAAINGGKPVDGQSPGVFKVSAGPSPANAVKTAAQYVDERTPRIAAFMHTAPVYDALTQPAVAPYPAACLRGKWTASADCRCYTQQGTVLPTSRDVCLQIVANGFFVDWQQQEPSRQPERQPAAHPPTSAPLPAAQPLLVAPSQGGGSETAPIFSPPAPVQDAPFVATVRQEADGRVMRAMKTGDWTRN